MIRQILLTVCAFAVGGCCAGKRNAPQPTELSLVDAMEQVGQGMHKMQAAARIDNDAQPFGFYGHDIVISFYVTVSDTKRGEQKLVVDGSLGAKVLPAGAHIGAKFEKLDGYESVTATGNTITIRFLNPMYAGKESLVHTATTQPAANAFEQLRKWFEGAPVN